MATPETSNMLRDASQNFIPQLWDPEANSGQGGFVPYGGSAEPPRLLGTITPTQITSTSLLLFPYPQSLNRNAQQRTFIFINSQMNVNLTALQIYPYDSTLVSSVPPNTAYFASVLPPLNNTQVIATSEDSTSPRFQILASHVDSVQVGVSFSAVPVQGSVGGFSVYVVEYFD